jgi:hypothetical protein
VDSRRCGLDRCNADDCGSGSLDAVTGGALYALSQRHLPLEHPAARRPEMGRAVDVRGRRAGSTRGGVAAARSLQQDRSSDRVTDAPSARAGTGVIERFRMERIERLVLRLRRVYFRKLQRSANIDHEKIGLGGEKPVRFGVSKGVSHQSQQPVPAQTNLRNLRGLTP